MISLLSYKIPIRFLCRYFAVSTSYYYKWKKGVQTKAAFLKAKVCKAIREIFKMSKQTYGSPRVHAELKEQGFKVCKNTVAKYMKELGLDARHKKTFKVLTTDSNHTFPIAPRLFKTEDKDLPTEPGKILAGQCHGL